MKRLWRAMTRLAVLALAATAALAACNAPFIPVPPPDNIFVSQTISDGTGNSKTVWIAQGKPDERAGLATFFFKDVNLGTGVIVEAKADGTYTAPPMDGTRGDRVLVSYTTPEGNDSEVVCRQLIEGDPAPSCPP